MVVIFFLRIQLLVQLFITCCIMMTCVAELEANLCRYNITKKKHSMKCELNFPVGSLKKKILRQKMF